MENPNGLATTVLCELVRSKPLVDAILNVFLVKTAFYRGLAWTPPVGMFMGSNEKARPMMECSNRGICDRATGECECFKGYEGMACQRAGCFKNKKTGEECSSKGFCVPNKELARRAGRVYDQPWDALKVGIICLFVANCLLIILRRFSCGDACAITDIAALRVLRGSARLVRTPWAVSGTSLGEIALGEASATTTPASAVASQDFTAMRAIK